MKIKICIFATIAALLSLFVISCIPIAPAEDNPTPQTDTSVVYKNPNLVVTNLDHNNNYDGVFVDLDNDNLSDIRFTPFNGPNWGGASIDSINSDCQLAHNNINHKWFFILNEQISDSNFSAPQLTFSPNGSGITYSYFGFRLLKYDGYHYGWMYLKMEATLEGVGIPTYTKIKTTLMGYAYKIAPNTPIQAGKY